MRILSIPLIVCVLFFSGPSIAGQPERDPRALAAVQQAIAAMGGSAAAARVTDTVVTGTIEPSSGSSVKGGAFTWKTAASEFKYEKRAGSSTQVLVSGHGHPKRIHNGTITALSLHIALANPPLHLPALVLADVVANQDYSVRLLGRADVSGVDAIKVRIGLDRDLIHSLVTPQDWYFDALTGIPIRVEHRLPDNRRADNYVTAAEEFGDYRSASGLLVPFRILSYESGALVAVETVSTVRFNSGLSSSEFDGPSGGAQ